MIPAPSRLVQALLIALCTTAATTAAAQIYRCPTGTGSYTLSDRPCPGAPGELRQYGPLPGADLARPSPAAYARTQEAPPHYDFLSAECRGLNDALRTAAVRGLNHDTQRDLQRQWSARCSENDQDARQRWSEKQRGEREQRQAERRQAEAAAERSRVEKEQCGEMLRILTAKRKRTDLTPGEQADLRRFEDNHRQRCGG